MLNVKRTRKQVLPVVDSLLQTLETSWQCEIEFSRFWSLKKHGLTFYCCGAKVIIFLAWSWFDKQNL